jgi:hypothetical protein
VRRLIAALAAVAVVLAVLAARPREDDRPVDPRQPAAQRAIAAATEVVGGQVVEVARDVDNGKWEVILRRDGRDYEVELDPRDYSLLRIDYD